MPDLVTIESFTSPWEAHIARGRLEAEGIPASVIGEHHIGAHWPISQALGGVRLMVPKSAAAEALDVLRALHSGKFQADLEAETGLTKSACPHCGSDALEPYRTRSSIAMAIASVLSFAITFPPTQRGLRCTSCGKRSPY